MTSTRAPIGTPSGASAAVVAAGLVLLAATLASSAAPTPGEGPLDAQLARQLGRAGFTGRVEATLAARLGRPLDRRLAEVGRVLWFDTITGLAGDNTCGGCHSPTNGFGDTQSIAIGIDSNRIVGPHRAGPRNMRRSPMVINAAFYPRLMWNSRFAALSGDPFDRRGGFSFPPPEGTSLSYLPHLLVAQAFVPPTERAEVAGFEFPGDSHAIRAEVTRRVDETAEYRALFGRLFQEVRHGRPITFDMIASAIAEFEFSLTFADAPIDRFARGERDALTESQKRGAMLFFGRARCVTCHVVGGPSNEMFSDFREHVLAVPQISPRIANMPFDGPGADEDFGREQHTGNPADRYAFRTSPLRNLALQRAFMHNGAFTSIEAAVRHHLDPFASARAYDPVAQHLDADLTGATGPIEPLLERLDPMLAAPSELSREQFDDLIAFLREGLLDPRAAPVRLQKLVPERVPSGSAMLRFEFARR